ncbi:MAG: hypothetical protein AUK34_07800 [Ignavibacteria bacterium CG2_30_36_16]|nr:MAG: hypothetical protein AUK34_07800 [Ignavibacteria bacterium CG2_30_36_16]
MKLNKRQKRTLFIALLLIAAALLVWIGFGGEIFTKTKVLVEIQDEIFGTTKEWKDQFVLGLDYTLAFSGITVLLALVFTFLQRDKKQK